MKNQLDKILIIILITTFGFIFHHKYINEFPSHIHAWAQSDRYALSLGFTENNFNFFKPQTFVLNHQFPDKWKVPSKSSVTSVDFPIHDYISAILMKISGSKSPFIFRTYILLYSFLGLFFLFRLSKTVTNDYFKSFFIVIIAATSPIYVYYQGGFLPSIPSLSNTIIALYFYYRYLKEDKKKLFWWSIMFLTLAALARTTFVIPLVAVICVEFVRILKKETKPIHKIAPLIISFTLILSYLVYNGYLRDVYGSIFLNHLMPAENLNEVKDIILTIYEKWFFQYFTALHYGIFILIFISSIILFFRRKHHTEKAKMYLGLFSVTYIFGCLIFAIAMLKQFPAHDYYFLDTFFLPILVITIVLLSLFPKIHKMNYKIISVLVILILFGFLLEEPIKSQKERRKIETWNRNSSVISNYENSDKFLDSLNIPMNSKLLVIDAVAPNIPFIKMKRKGYAVMETKSKNIEQALNWDYDYIVFENEYFMSDIFTAFPNIVLHLNKIADNGKISICTYAEKSNQTLEDFIGLNTKNINYEEIIDFDNESQEFWKNTLKSNKHGYKSKICGHLKSNKKYGLTFKTHKIPDINSTSSTLFFSSYFLSNTIVDCKIVVSISSEGNNIYYKSKKLNYSIKKRGKWQNASLLFKLPRVETENYEFKLYILNTGSSELFYDDFKFSIYEQQ